MRADRPPRAVVRALAACSLVFANLVPAVSACELPARPETTLAWRQPASHPSAVLAVGFGLRLHPLLGINRLHTGLDWRAPLGSDVRAAETGRVVEAARSGEYGNRIRIDHGGGWQTTYSHLNRFAPVIVAGACVAAGEVIAEIGNTGLSTEPHLHFEVLRDGAPIDPQAR